MLPLVETQFLLAHLSSSDCLCNVWATGAVEKTEVTTPIWMK